MNSILLLIGLIISVCTAIPLKEAPEERTDKPPEDLKWWPFSETTKAPPVPSSSQSAGSTYHLVLPDLSQPPAPGSLSMSFGPSPDDSEATVLINGDPDTGLYPAPATGFVLGPYTPFDGSEEVEEVEEEEETSHSPLLPPLLPALPSIGQIAAGLDPQHLFQEHHHQGTLEDLIHDPYAIVLDPLPSSLSFYEYIPQVKKAV